MTDRRAFGNLSFVASKTDITTRLRDVMQADRHRIRRLWRQAEKADDKRSGELEQEIESRIKDSHQKCENRRAAVPKINLPSELPITEHAESIVEMIQNHRVLVLCGETGSGNLPSYPNSACRRDGASTA